MIKYMDVFTPRTGCAVLRSRCWKNLLTLFALGALSSAYPHDDSSSTTGGLEQEFPPARPVVAHGGLQPPGLGAA